MKRTPAQEGSSGPAGEYARALLDLAQEQGREQPLQEELSALAELGRTVERLDEFLTSPAIAAAAKLRALRQALGERLSPLTWSFLAVLLRNERGGLLGEVAGRFTKLRRVRAGAVDVTVSSAVPLDEPLREELARMLREAMKAEPVLELKVDESLLGGLRVQVGDRVVDASLATVLGRMRSALAKPPRPREEGATETRKP